MNSYLGQNFLIDNKVKNYIFEQIKKIYEKNNLDCIIEIGPGKGAITSKIKDISKNFFVIEKDESMEKYLNKIINKKQIIFGDILETDILKTLKNKKIETKKTLVIGSLPYYITSPIFKKFFGDGKNDFFGGFFMIQNEVGEKIKSDAKKKSFLWWILNYGNIVKYKKKVGRKSFNPKPKVESCLIEIHKKEKTENIEFSKLYEFLNLYSSFSRKTLGAINKILLKQNKKNFYIPTKLEKKRLEELSFVEIKKIIKETS